MIDPLLSLTMSMHSNPGIFALLLGSGVSRMSGIPTGWEITIDLIEKLAAIEGEDCLSGPEQWYTDKYGQPPTYGGVLAEVATTPAVRRGVVSDYFEPSEADEDKDLKVPTKAHRAIANLVKAKHIRFILTTNFDRLMERALGEIDLEPVVIASPEAAAGATPLLHSPCMIIKVNGDYLDPQIKNTTDELGSYAPEIDKLLDRILDECGLIVCGWSGEWDTALGDAILRCPNRRFSTYWTTIGDVADEATPLIQHRAAQAIPIDGADEFFTQLAGKLDTLSKVDRAHPMSVKLLTAQTKKFLMEEKHLIDLDDLVMAEVAKIVTALSSDKYPVLKADDHTGIRLRIEQLESLTEGAGSIIATGCYWGSAGHWPTWTKAFERLIGLLQPWRNSGPLETLTLYPAALCLYAGTIAALAAGELETVAALFSMPAVRTDRGASAGLLEMLAFEPRRTVFLVCHKTQFEFPRCERLFSILHGVVREFVPSEQEYERLFARCEILMCLWEMQRGRRFPGRFMVEYPNPENLKEFIAEHDELGEEWPVQKAGLSLPDQWDTSMGEIKDVVRYGYR